MFLSLAWSDKSLSNRNQTEAVLASARLHERDTQIAALHFQLQQFTQYADGACGILDCL
jgi:hypothetical protein